MQTVELSVRFVVEILAHTRDPKSILLKWLEFMKQIFTDNLYSSRWFFEALTKNQSWLRQMIIICPSSNSRTAFAGLIIPTLKSIVANEKLNPTTPGLPSVVAESSTLEKAKLSQQFIETLISLLKAGRNYYRNFAQYFQVLYEYSSLGLEERRYLISIQIITKLTNFYLSEERVSGEKLNPPDLSYMMEIISILVRSCSTERGTPPTIIPGPVLELSTSDKEQLLSKLFLTKMIKEGINMEATSDILRYWCWDNERLSKILIDLICDGIDRLNFDQFKPYFHLLTSILEKIADGLVALRYDYGLTTLLKVIEKNTKYKNATESCITYFVQVGNKQKEARDWIFTNKAIVNNVLGKAGLKLKN